MDNKIKKMVYDNIAYLIEADLNGNDELLTKEVWEACQNEEDRRDAKEALRSIIAHLNLQSI